MELNLRSSAQKVADNDDLLSEILVLLPTKTLLNFQLVSKQWHSLILSDPHFSRLHTRLHTRRPRPHPSFILRSSATSFSHFNPITNSFLPLTFTSPYTKILQSCNGLLLLESRITPFSKKEYRVYNPVTKQSRPLSIKIIDDNEAKRTNLSGICLAFDPSRSPHFKIICVVAKHGVDRQDYSIEVYESEFDRWSVCTTALFPPRIQTTFINGFYHNNRVYWIRPTSTSFYFDLEKGHVRRVSTKIKGPSRRNGEINKKYVMESNGHVHCVSIYWGAEKKSLLVFELLDDNSWFEMCRVDLNPISLVLPEMDRNNHVSVLGIVRGERREDSFVLIHVPGKIVRYRFFYARFEVVIDLTASGIYGERGLQFGGRCDSFQFVVSLAPV